jgi:hypothetical protein
VIVASKVPLCRRSNQERPHGGGVQIEELTVEASGVMRAWQWGGASNE